MSLTARFEQMARHFCLFGFLHNIKKIAEFDQNDLMKCCMDLNIAFTDASGSDIDPKDLCSELQIFSNIVPDKNLLFRLLLMLYVLFMLMV